MSLSVIFVADAAIWTAAGLNIFLSFRLHRRSQELAKIQSGLQSRYLPDLIKSIDETCDQVCPFCALATGKLSEAVLQRMSDQSEYSVHTEPECDGHHRIIGGPPDLPEDAHRIPCNAAPLHQLSRQLFNDFMQETSK